MRSAVTDAHARGSASFINLSAYAFGFSGMWTGFGSGILPFKVLEILDRNSVTILGHDLDKNGTLGVISLVGLAAAAAVQPTAGIMSDRAASGRGGRLPYIIVGAAGMAVVAFYIGIATTFLTLLTAIVLLQVTGNLSQGPANALILDHVPPSKMGRAAGALNLARVAGAGFLTVAVLSFMGRYDADTASQWIWYAIILMAIVLLITSLWTVTALRRTTTPPATSHEVPAGGQLPEPTPRDRRAYGWFLFSLAFVIAAMSSMQVYALFFLQDVVGLENPAGAAAQLVVVVGGTTALTVYPAGLLADRLGRDRLLVVAGLIGALSAALLLFAHTMPVVLLDGVIIGISIGVFLSVTWAVAQNLVSRHTAARDLGLTSIATLVGSAMARSAGIGIDALNGSSPNLGYHVMLGAIAAAFVVSAVMLGYVAKQTLVRQPPEVMSPSPLPSDGG